MKNVILGIFIVGLYGVPLQALEKKTLPTSGKTALDRWVGQTDFEDHDYSLMRMEAAVVSDSSSERAVQESDVFKIGKEGSKTLYLLNNYKGLQIVSFKNGAEAPELVGEVKPTGNSPRDMYYQAAQDRLLVLERNWFDGGYWSETQSRIVSYDVSSEDSPRIDQTLDIKGTVVDHRMVGDVLYVVTKIQGAGSDWYTNNKNASGYVYSYNVATSKLKVVDVQKMAIPPSYNQGLVNIQAVLSPEGEYKYYMVAALSVSGWFWRSDEASYVEVMDISSSVGKIEPLMVAPIKGRISERSSTLIRDNSLVVTSNYNLRNGNNEKARIAVEVFSLPNENSAIISTKEMNKKIEELNSRLRSDKTESYTKDLIEALGIQNTFTEDVIPSRLVKSAADVVMTVGDSRGQHAVLQDVRVEDDLLYVFWVPQDRIDPLDVFDLSNVGKGELSHLTHLEFEGWVEKAYPVTYKGNKYIIGLGWVEPTVNNDSGERYPQVYVFEITKRGSKYQASQIYDKAFKVDSAGWSQLNKLDKYFEFKQNDKGVVEILFPFSSYTDNRYRSGGKIAYIDLEAVFQEKDSAITEGSFLVGESGWLKRIFYNSSLERFNAFSDKKLYVYQDASFSTATVDVAVTLELAKNIEDILPASEGTVYQVVSLDNDSVELREVSSKNKDAQKKEALLTHSLAGQYSHSFSLGDKSYVVTTKSHYKKVTKTYTNGRGEEVSYEVNEYLNTTYNAYEVHKKEMSLIKNWVSVDQGNWDRGFGILGGFGNYRGYSSQTVNGKLLSGGKTVLAQMATGVVLLDAASGGVDLYSTKGCGDLGKMSPLEYKILNGSLYSVYSVSNAAAERKKNYIVSMSLQDGALTCETNHINIPGSPLTLTSNGDLLVSDSWNDGESSSNGYLLLSIQDSKAVLKEALSGGASISVLNENTLVGSEPAVVLDWKDRYKGESFNHKFTFVKIEKGSFSLDDTLVELKSYNVSIDVLADASGSYYVWLNGFRDQLAIINVADTDVTVQTLKPSGETAVDTDFVKLPGYRNKVKIDSQGGVLTLVRGYYGVDEFTF